MTTDVTVTAAPFNDEPGMPHVHTDARRTITEVAPTNDAGMLDRITRIEVTGTEVALGNHYHDFDEAFSGTGGGKLLTVHKDDPREIVTVHDLPTEGWVATIPAGVVHTFVLSAPAVLVSKTDRHFVAEGNRSEHPDEPINTHVSKLV
jgi:hypothetical protein